MRYIALFFLILMVGCKTTKQTIVTPKEQEIKVYRDSIILRDSVVVIPVEKVTDITKLTDTLTLETSLAIAKSWIDDERLKGNIQNKKQYQYKEKIITQYIERTDTIRIPEPYEVIKEVKYLPKIYKYALVLLCLILCFYGFKLYKKIIL